MNLMVFPSNYEIFGMVLLEAMYFDLPVMSSLNGGSDTLITDNIDGIIVNGFDSSVWASKILELSTDVDKYNRIRDNLKSKDHVVYTWDGIARKYTEILDKYLAEK